ncbi:leucine-rich repeat domain-containing protein [Adlercreutzia faecimuris]|uniref:Leucine-rich repeat protein n=1 Tax=Adlercreutzia faecimuris TaxID=2897341 RepID=A0ABS9WE39_9ACTN|nr:leucine-rich repeat domain-containing protein [Adlercreutzia sp. JBNU-10]MCI2241131.1 leucine-rich repeat protein [Adlercreutzia sp. JBNU-10]
MGDGFAQRERLEGTARGDESPRVLPFGVVMRDLAEGRHLVARRAEYAAAARAGGADAEGADAECGAGAAGAARAADGANGAGGGCAADAPDAAGAAGEPERPLPSVRLSPVELRNLEMIDDPALEGLRAARGTAAPAPPRVRPATGGEGAGAGPDPRRLQGGIVDHLVIGPEVEVVEPGPHGPRARLSVAVDPANPRFSTDGRALFSRDGRVLVALIVPCAAYDVPDGCVEVGPRAFDSLDGLERVSLPEGLRRIGRLAFAKSGLAFVAVPGTVDEVGEKAFFGCAALRACLLAEGVRAVGAEAFAQTALERIALPASLRELGRGAFRATPAQRAAHAGAITVDAGNPVLAVDADGGLYRDGAFAELLSCVPAYAVRPGTPRVLDGACLRNATLRAVTLPEGLEAIGDDAFRGARGLREVALPATVRSIGDRALMDTAVRRLRLPRDLGHLGDSALLVQGENPLRSSRPLQDMELDPANPRFYVESGLLCERGAGDGGADKALLYVGPDSRVRIPDAVNRLAPGAFLGATGVDELTVHGHLHSVCAGALSVARSIPLLRVEFPRPLDGWADGEFPVPSLSPRYRTYTHLIGTDAEGTAFQFAYYDSWVSHATAIEELAPAALGRLRRPVRLDGEMAAIYRGILARKQAAVCRLFAQRGDLEALEDLAAWGLLGRDAVEDELRAATRAGNAQATATLLELGCRRGWVGAGLDMSL